MSRLGTIIYSFLVLPLLLLAVHVAALFNRRLRRALAGRYQLMRDLQRHGTETLQSCIIIHAASLGEFEHIKPLISRLSARYPNPLLVSFFSPSGYEHVKQFPGVARFIYLPFDLRRTWKKFYRRLNPSVVIISKHDVWPNMVISAAAAGIPVILVNGSMASQSDRNSWPAKLILSQAYRRLSYIFAISEADKKRLCAAFGLSNVTVAGDTKFDQVLIRKEQSQDKNLLAYSWRNGAFVLAFGSIWPQDAEIVLHDITALLKKFPRLKLLIVPHQPEREILQKTLSYFPDEKYDIFSQTAPDVRQRIVVVDVVGVLADLYRYASAAYVGGSFKQGIHSTMEPAIYSIPVIYGPEHANSHEAMELREAGGGLVIQKPSEFHSVMEKLISDPDFRQQTGAQAAGYALKNTGTTQIIIEYLHHFLV